MERPNWPFLTPHPGRHAKLVQKMSERIDVRQPRQVGKGQRLIGKQRAGQKRQCGILRAADGNLASRRLPPLIQMLSITAL
jgi:hypothetical protein